MMDLTIRRPSLRPTTFDGRDGHHHHARSCCPGLPRVAGEAQECHYHGWSIDIRPACKARPGPSGPRSGPSLHRPAVLPPRSSTTWPSLLHHRRLKGDLAGRRHDVIRSTAEVRSPPPCHLGFTRQLLGWLWGWRTEGQGKGWCWRLPRRGATPPDEVRGVGVMGKSLPRILYRIQ
jgi:hypothetical protein